MTLTLGPIVGDVQNGQARILAEFNTSDVVTLQLVGQQGTNLQAQNVVLTNRPQIFVFNGVKAGELYKITYENTEIGSFTAIKNDGPKDLRFGVVSCNSIFHGLKLDKEKQLWRDLQERIKNQEIEFLLHIGDQIYVDQDYWVDPKESNCGFAKIEKLLKGLTPDKFDTKLEEAREIMREEYRKTWGFEPTRYCLANCPNRMILDDHDVLDDAGKDQELQDPNHWKGWYSQKVARYVYYEYQKVLIKDIDMEQLDKETEEFFQFKVKDSGFFVMDNRGHFLWHGDKMAKGESYLGQIQKKAFYDGLKDNGFFSGVKSLFIISTVPLVFCTETVMKIGAKTVTNDFTQFFGFDHENQMVELFDLLRKWQEQDKNRVVTLIGGDIHLGGHTEILYNHKPFAKQMITSAMTSPSLTLAQTLGYEATQAFSNQKLQGNYCFRHHSMAFCNNYGIVEVKDDDKGRLVKMNLVKNKKVMKLGKTQTNRIFQGDGCTSCTII